MKMHKLEKLNTLFLASLYMQFLNFRKATGEYLGAASPKLLKILKMMCSKVDKFVTEEKDETLKNKMLRDLVQLKIEILMSMEDYLSTIALINQHIVIFEYTEHLDTFTKIVQILEKSAPDGEEEILGEILKGFSLTLTS